VTLKWLQAISDCDGPRSKSWQPCLLTIFVLLAMAGMGQVHAQPSKPAGQVYLGNFLGYGSVSSGQLRQLGQTIDEEGVVFGVDAAGPSRASQALSAGLHAGYEWPAISLGQGSNQRLLRPALEAEILYLTHSRKGTLANAAPASPSHVFNSRVSMNIGAFLINGVLTLNAPSAIVQPYMGLGAGTALVTASGLDSVQLSQTERIINFFNPRLNSSSNGLALMGKAGFRSVLSDNMEFFAEYRFMQLAATDYRFGPALLVNQFPSESWRINVSPMRYHLGIIGIRFKF
jgi:opacity protein-like surface antigen